MDWPVDVFADALGDAAALSDEPLVPDRAAEVRREGIFRQLEQRRDRLGLGPIVKAKP